MKKLVFAVLAAVFLAGAAFAEGKSAINVKVGVDFAGDVSYGDDGNGGNDVKTGFSFAGEYLYKFNDVFKLGGGIEYLAAREIDGDSRNIWSDNPKISYMPIYVSVEVSPIAPLRELYLKGNLGYNAIFDFDNENIDDASGGVYFGLGAGYVFDFGLILEAVYGFYYGSATADDYYDVTFTYTKLGLNIGYRFNI